MPRCHRLVRQRRSPPRPRAARSAHGRRLMIDHFFRTPSPKRSCMAWFAVRSLECSKSPFSRQTLVASPLGYRCGSVDLDHSRFEGSAPLSPQGAPLAIESAKHYATLESYAFLRSARSRGRFARDTVAETRRSANAAQRVDRASIDPATCVGIISGATRALRFCQASEPSAGHRYDGTYANHRCAGADRCIRGKSRSRICGRFGERACREGDYGHGACSPRA